VVLLREDGGKTRYKNVGGIPAELKIVCRVELAQAV